MTTITPKKNNNTSCERANTIQFGLMESDEHPPRKILFNINEDAQRTMTVDETKLSIISFQYYWNGGRRTCAYLSLSGHIMNNSSASFLHYLVLGFSRKLLRNLLRFFFFHFDNHEIFEKYFNWKVSIFSKHVRYLSYKIIRRFFQLFVINTSYIYYLHGNK